MTDFENEVRTRLASLAQRAPSGPTLDLSDDEHPARREFPSRARRGRFLVPALGTALAVASVAVVASVAGGLGSQSDGNDGPAAFSGGNNTSGSLAESTTSPVDDGATRVAAWGRVGVDVPSGWGSQLVSCGVATADTVYYRSSSTLDRSCMWLGAPGDSVTIQNITGAAGGDPATVGGLEVTVARSTVGEQQHQVVISVPTHGVQFVVTTADEADGEDIARSVHLLPDEQVAIPELVSQGAGAPSPDELADQLRDLGLQPNVSFAEGASAQDWSTYEMIPSVGTILAPGSPVDVIYSRSPKGMN